MQPAIHRSEGQSSNVHEPMCSPFTSSIYHSRPPSTSRRVVKFPGTQRTLPRRIFAFQGTRGPRHTQHWQLLRKLQQQQSSNSLTTRFDSSITQKMTSSTQPVDEEIQGDVNECIEGPLGKRPTSARGKTVSDEKSTANGENTHL